MNLSTLRSLIESRYTLLTKYAGYLQAPILTVLRVYWGWQFFQTGLGKLGNLGRTAEFFGSLGIPFPTLNALMAGATECGGGLLLAVGFASRLVSIPLIATMIVAYITAERETVLHLFSNPDKFTAADPFLFLLVALLVLAFGPGPISIDNVIRRKLSCPVGNKAH